MGLGFLVALPIYKLLSPDVRYLPFALFMGVAMSITAFPVLARILIERRMLKRPVGALALASAAIDDVTAWGLLALATAVAGSGKATHAIQVILLAAVFTLQCCRDRPAPPGPALEGVRRSRARCRSSGSGVIFVASCCRRTRRSRSAIASIFGAFVMGLIMPRRAGPDG